VIDGMLLGLVDAVLEGVAFGTIIGEILELSKLLPAFK